MGEWNEDGPMHPRHKLLMALKKEEREAFAAWRRGEPSPPIKQMEARAPKHIYGGNRKARRASAAKGRKP